MITGRDHGVLVQQLVLEQLRHPGPRAYGDVEVEERRVAAGVGYFYRQPVFPVATWGIINGSSYSSKSIAGSTPRTFGDLSSCANVRRWERVSVAYPFDETRS
jgi:hypothetical protein